MPEKLNDEFENYSKPYEAKLKALQNGANTREEIRSALVELDFSELLELIAWEDEWTKQTIYPYDPHEFIAFVTLEEVFDNMNPFLRDCHMELRQMRGLLNKCANHEDIDNQQAIKAYGEGVPIEDIIAE